MAQKWRNCSCCQRPSLEPRLSSSFSSLAVRKSFSVLQATKSWMRAWVRGYQRPTAVLSHNHCIMLLLSMSCTGEKNKLGTKAYTGNTGIWLTRVELTYLVLLLLGSRSHGFPHGSRGTAPAVEDPGGGGLGGKRGEGRGGEGRGGEERGGEGRGGEGRGGEGRGGEGSWEGKERWYKIP